MLARPRRFRVGAQRGLGLQQQTLCHTDFRFGVHTRGHQRHEVACS
ncbi:Uncharacterised protein [Mycobacteroides abscessus subsp. abscessus]|nr:Uncharacterised protein [Mycobacteroides abscessus subsp. abscessus]